MSARPQDDQGLPRWRRALFEHLYRLVRYRAWWVLFVSLLLSSLALYSVRDLPTRASFLDLLPQNDPLLEAFKLRQTLLQRSDSLQILLRLTPPYPAPETGTLRLVAAAEALKPRLERLSEVAEVSYRLDPRLVLFRQLQADPHRLTALQGALARAQGGLEGLSPELAGQADLADLYRRLNDLLEGQAEGALAQGSQPLQEALEKLKALNDEVDQALRQLPQRLQQSLRALEDLNGLLAELEAELAEPVPNLAPDGRQLLLTVRAVQPSYLDLRFNRRLLARVRNVLAAAGLEGQGLRAGIGGSYAFTAESSQAMQRDVLVTTLISLGGILLVFVLTFRGLIYPALIVIPLSMSAVWTAAWARWAFGGFNLITAMLPALLLGLGINYGIHFVSRFLEARRQGRGVSAALHETLLAKGDALLSGALTTALVFFVMMSARSRGLYEMGVVAGVGVLVSVLLTLLVLPALVVLTQLVLRRRLRRPAGFRWGLSGLVGLVVGRRRTVIVLLLLATAGLAGPAGQVRVRFISEELEISGLPSQQTRQLIRRAGFPESTTSGDYFVFFLPDEAHVRRLTRTLEDDPLVLTVISAQNYFQSQVSLLADLNLETAYARSRDLIASLLTNLANQQELTQQLARMEANLRRWKELADLFGQEPIAQEANALIVQLLSIQDRLNRLDVPTLRASLLELGQTLDRLKALAGRTLNLPRTVDDFLQALPPELRQQLITPENEFVVYVEVDKALYLEDNYDRFLARVRPITEDYIGPPMIQHRLETITKSDFWRSTLGALGLIVFSLFLDFAGYRLWGGPWLVLLPLAVGYVWMLGGMGLLGISFNLTNMVISPLLIGIGVDNGIHLLHRYLERRHGGEPRPRRVRRAAEAVAMPLLVANLTTMTAFGSLLFASTPGLQVLGKSALLGVGAVAFCSLTLLPAVLARRR